MNLGKHTIQLAIITMAGLTAASANAQNVLSGTFHLPVKAYCGGTVLQPGDYSLSMIKEPTGISVLHLTGEEVSASFISNTGATEQSPRTYLKLTGYGDTYVIRELDAGLIGKTFTFAAPKNIKDIGLHADASRTMTLAVSSGDGR